MRIEPPELASLPWEFAYDESIADFFVMNPATAIVRYHGVPLPPASISAHAPVPILLLISNPPGTDPLSSAEEVGSLLDSLAPLLPNGRVRVDLLFSGPPDQRRAVDALVRSRGGARLLPGEASVDELRDALRQGYRVVHFYRHGTFDQAAGGALILTDRAGARAVVGGETIVRELRGRSGLVVILNACETAVEGTVRAFIGLAPAITRAGIPAVVAMQYRIRATSAAVFSGELYRALADGWPLDAAVTEWRKAIGAHTTPEKIDWGIPVLFMRSPDGVIWRAPGEDNNRRQEETMSLTVAAIGGIVTATAKYLAASKAGEKVSEAAGDALVKVGASVFSRLKATLGQRGDTARKADRALADVADDPGDQEYQRNLTTQLERLAKDDAELRSVLSALSAEVQRAQPESAAPNVHNEVAGDVYGPVGSDITGDLSWSFGTESAQAKRDKS